MAKIEIAPLGEFLREQRRNAQLSLRQLAEQAGVSNPYLSQIERGLRKPSAEILQQIAKGLRISSEQLYVQAGILDERPAGELAVEAAVLSDAALHERQKRVLLEIYRSFRAENDALAGASADAPPPSATKKARGPGAKKASTPASSGPKSPAAKSTATNSTPTKASASTASDTTSATKRAAGRTRASRKKPSALDPS